MPRSKNRSQKDSSGLVLLFIAPSFIIVAGFIAYPAILTAYYSLFKFTGLSTRNYIGLENWQRLISDPLILESLIHNIFLVAVTLILQIPFAFAVALLLARGKIFGRRIYRSAFFFPVIISVTVAGLLWSWVYNPQYGILNEGLRSLGLSNLVQPWLADSQLVLPAVSLVIIWKWIGFYIVIFMAGLASIPQDIYDVASIDGANLFQLAFYVVGPMLREVFIVTLAIGISASIKRFDLVYIMTQGGPVHYSEVLATYLYKEAFRTFDMGYASTIAFFLFLLTLSLIVIQIHFSRSDEIVEF